MPTPILMPALSPTMEEGKLAKWHVREGDEVRAGDIIAEIETDKATMEVEAVDDGKVGQILVPEGAEHVRVNEPIALLLQEGEEASSFETQPAAAPQDEEKSFETRPAAAPQDEEKSFETRPAAAPQDEEKSFETQPAAAPQDEEESIETGPAAAPQDEEENEGAFARGEPADDAEQVMTRIAEQIRRNGRDRLRASPLAKRLARERGIDLRSLSGSGPRGRIVKQDIEQAARARPGKQPEAEIVERAAPAERREARGLVPARAAPEPGLSDEQVLALYEPGSYRIVPHDTMRRLIAERLTLSKQTIPHFYLNIDCELDAVLAARKRLNGMAPEDGPRSFKLSLNDFIIKALAMALQKVPNANATWTESGILLHRASDIAVAVALPDGGLHTPVLRNAELKSLSEISNEMRDLAARARSKRLAPHEYQGGTTTISNLGMYGIDRFEAVINPPQASILAVGRAEKRPVIRDDAVKIATMMSATLSVDHRVIDGALGADLLAAFKAFIEDPVTMLV